MEPTTGIAAGGGGASWTDEPPLVDPYATAAAATTPTPTYHERHLYDRAAARETATGGLPGSFRLAGRRGRRPRFHEWNDRVREWEPTLHSESRSPVGRMAGSGGAPSSFPTSA